MIENYKNSTESEIKNPGNAFLAKNYARRMATKNCKVLSSEEREGLLERLFNSNSFDIATDGKKVFIELTPDKIESWF